MISYFVFFCLMVTLVAGQVKECSNDTDCGEGECCITFGRKRFLFSPGHCKKFSDLGEACEPPEMVHGSEHTFSCPCSAGLECHGDMEYHQPGGHSYTNPHCTNPIVPTPTEAPPTTTVV